MSKKILSFVLILAIMMSTVIFTSIGANAEETVSWKVGDQPFAVDGGRQEPLVIKASEGEFYDDFIIPGVLNFDSYVPRDTYIGTAGGTPFQLNRQNSSLTLTTSSGKEYISMSLSQGDENPNAYGGKNGSVKVTTTAGTGTYGKDSSGNNVGYNSLRMKTAIDCSTYPSLDDIAIAFWVKTTGPATFSMACFDTEASGDKQKIHADPVNVSEAGEYIIAFPLQNFYISDNTYNKATDISSFKIQWPEILFKATGLESNDETIDIYFDNLGVYPVMPNFGKATHSRGAYIKDNMDDYSNPSAKTVYAPSLGGNWTVTDATTASAFSAVDHNEGKALCYTASTYTYTQVNDPFSGETTGSKNTIRGLDTGVYAITDEKGNNLGSNATIAFWVKASRASRVSIATNNFTGAAWLYSTDVKIPAGESIVRIPLSQFIETDNRFINFKKLRIYFTTYSPTTGSLGGTTGTFMVDDIAIEPTVVDGDVNNDKICDLIDIVRLKKIMDGAVSSTSNADLYADQTINSRDVFVLRRFLLGASETPLLTPALISQESFVEKTITANDGDWGNRNPESLSYELLESAPYYYSGSKDAKSLEVKYSSLTSGGVALFYNKNLSPGYGSDSVLSFWVYTDQPIVIRCNYLDWSNTDNKSVQSNNKEITLPAGESIVEIPMSELAPEGKDMAYTRVLQLFMRILPNSSSSKTEGTVYFDSFGFYDKDTTNDIGYIPAVTE